MASAVTVVLTISIRESFLLEGSYYHKLHTMQIFWREILIAWRQPADTTARTFHLSSE